MMTASLLKMICDQIRADIMYVRGCFGFVLSFAAICDQWTEQKVMRRYSICSKIYKIKVKQELVVSIGAHILSRIMRISFAYGRPCQLTK